MPWMSDDDLGQIRALLERCERGEYYDAGTGEFVSEQAPSLLAIIDAARATEPFERLGDGSLYVSNGPTYYYNVSVEDDADVGRIVHVYEGGELRGNAVEHECIGANRDTAHALALAILELTGGES